MSVLDRAIKGKEGCRIIELLFSSLMFEFLRYKSTPKLPPGKHDIIIMRIPLTLAENCTILISLPLCQDRYNYAKINCTVHRYSLGG